MSAVHTHIALQLSEIFPTKNNWNVIWLCLNKQELGLNEDGLEAKHVVNHWVAHRPYYIRHGVTTEYARLLHAAFPVLL